MAGAFASLFGGQCGSVEPRCRSRPRQTLRSVVRRDPQAVYRTLAAGTDRLAGRRARPRDRESSGAPPSETGASLDHRIARQRDRHLTFGPRRTVPAVSVRESHGLSCTMASAAGRTAAQIHEPQRGGNCRRGRLRIGTLIQSRLQTAVWPPTGPLPEPVTGGAPHLPDPGIIQEPLPTRGGSSC